MVACTLACSPAYAQWFLDAGVESFDWREHTAPIEVHEQGPRFTFAAGWVQPKERGLLVALRGELYGGSLDYDGSFLFDPTKPASGNVTYLGTTQAAQLRWRWLGLADAAVGLEYETWKRRLTRTQEETYRIASLRLGVERVASAGSPIVAGGGMRFLLATGEEATFESDGVTYVIRLEPEVGSNPHLHAGYRVLPHVTVLGYWDGMNLGRSNQVAIARPFQPSLVVWQPEADAWRAGFRVVYGW